MIRRGRLWRICKRCNRSFCPTGKRDFICPKCDRGERGDWLKELSKKYGR